MHYTFSTENVICGFSDGHSSDGTVDVLVRELVSSEDGPLLLQRLEQVSQNILSRSPSKIPESSIDHLVAIFHKTGLVEVWVNELEILTKMRVTKTVEKGQPVLMRHIADVERMQFRNLEIPDGCGYLVMFSVRWQKALLYDFSPLHPGEESEPRDVSRLLGAAYSYLAFRDRFAPH